MRRFLLPTLLCTFVTFTHAQVAALELHQMAPGGSKVVPMNATLRLAVGSKLTLLVVGRTTDGQNVLGFATTIPENKTGYAVTRGTGTLEVTGTAPGEYTLAIGVPETGAAAFLNLSISSSSILPPPTPTTRPIVEETPPTPPGLSNLPPRTVELHVTQLGSTRKLSPGERLLYTSGNDLQLEAVGLDAGGRPTSAFQADWGRIPEGLSMNIAGGKAKMLTVVPGTYALEVRDASHPEASTWVNLVVHEAPGTTLPNPEGREGTGPGRITYRSEVHRICSNLDSHYRSLLAAYQARNATGVRNATSQITYWSTLLEAEEPAGIILYWDADGIIDECEDISEDLAENDWGDVRGNINSIHRKCTNCHNRDGRSSYVPPSVR